MKLLMPKWMPYPTTFASAPHEGHNFGPYNFVPIKQKNNIYYSKDTLSLNFKGDVTETPPPSTKVLASAMTGQPFELELVTSEPGQVVHHAVNAQVHGHMGQTYVAI